jgi:hypothetical protein
LLVLLAKEILRRLRDRIFRWAKLASLSPRFGRDLKKQLQLDAAINSEQAKPFLPATRVNSPDVDDLFDVVPRELSQQFVESKVQFVVCFLRV